ncbi:acyl carrier protein [Jatrophihabitans sp.]|uniref:acyl carrier protein n=1 Tax=Jatrophihabitans sp. TaxID=1932789 RepID=UPI0030C6AAB9|nr:acyl carrier protein [Jatrophihabitans sp.]
MEREIRQILAAHGRLGVDVYSLDADADLYRNGMTSHASVNVMIGLEEAFDVEFPIEMLRRSTFESVASIETALNSLTATLAG